MHVFVLLLIAFWAPVPAQGTTPAQAESVHTASAVTFSAADCQVLGEATASQVAQSKGVTHVGYVCVETSNPADKPV
jgi:hypothetical protein